MLSGYASISMIFSCPIFKVGGCIYAKTMPDDQQLLKRFVENRSEAAFSELVGRYVNLVYSTALRRTNHDTHLAQDVAQLVFTDLARKAPSLSRDVVLAGWLHRATRYAAAQMMRSDRRRRLREQEAAAMTALESETHTDWHAIRPELDDALDRLSQTDRDAILLRFFEQRSLAEIGSALGTNEDTARKRVSRALDKLRAVLIRKGLTTTAATLSAVISTHAVQLAPAGLAASLTSASLASAGAAAGITSTLLKIMGLTKLQFGMGASIVALLTAALVAEHHSMAALREENEALRQNVAQLNAAKASQASRLAGATGPRLPAPAVQLSTDPAGVSVDTLQSTNLYDRFKDGNVKLTAQQLESYLRANRRSAASLLAAYRTSKDPALLQEAMRNFPDDPQVAFEASMRSDATAEDRRKWLDVFKKSDPDNALANYLSALDNFKAGDTDDAIKEFTAASNKQFEDYTSERYQDDSEAYMAAGYSVADAKAVAGLQLLLPQLQQVKDLGHDFVDLSKSYQQAGDSASAQAALQMAISLGERYATSTPGEPSISQLVGIALEQYALKNMDPNSAYGVNGQTVQDRLNQVAQQRAALEERCRKVEAIAPTMADQDWINYRDRWLMFGEQNAENWVISKYGQQ
jgi:RNA polymerase sigma factor (sigma-70 family)